MTKPPENQRHIRIPDDMWKPFLDLTRAAEQLSGNAVLARHIRGYLEEYGVFWGPDPKTGEYTTFFECVECDASHRLDGQGSPPFCSVTKSRSDRLLTQR